MNEQLFSVDTDVCHYLSLSSSQPIPDSKGLYNITCKVGNIMHIYDEFYKFDKWYAATLRNVKRDKLVSFS